MGVLEDQLCARKGKEERALKLGWSSRGIPRWGSPGAWPRPWMGTAPDRGSLGDVPEDTIGATLEQVREGTLHFQPAHHSDGVALWF